VAAVHPAVAAIRTEVRRCLRSLPPDTSQPVLVACSGGADSLALAVAVAFLAPRLAVQVGLVTVDHQLQPGSADRAAAVGAWACGAGFDPVDVVAASVAGRVGGPEAAARSARYDALGQVARRHGSQIVLLGHTLDDQAETVLLALVRGSGLRGLAGMPRRRQLGGVALLRPLLGIERAQTRAACEAAGLRFWDDPHNSDPAFSRTQARALLASYVQALGPSVVANLARTATLAGAAAAVVDSQVELGLVAAARSDGLDVAVLRALPAAVRTGVLHAWARRLGVPGSALSHRHVVALDALVVGRRGQGAVDLPGAVAVRRDGEALVAARDTAAPAGPAIASEAGLVHG
jgi:tRNA(Ile)-lysidine synthase